MLAASLFAAPNLPPLRVEGTRLVDPSGQPVDLRGTNVGNWLILEMWMLGADGGEGQQSDQYDFEETLEKRFGSAERERLMELYRHSWMTPRDWRAIQSYGFNLVRLPINHRLIEEGETGRLKPEGLRWIDHAVRQAAAHGLYTILDMHGAPGGQSQYDHTGRRDQNKIWTDERAQERLAELWKGLAARYRDNPNVAAYDPFNEPYGGSKPDQVKLFERCYAAIRAEDSSKLILAHGNWDDFDHYGDPKEKGWTNVGFQMHYYPGLFGGGEPTLLTHARHLRTLPGIRARLEKLNVPFLVGEMNVVFQAAGGPAMMRRTFDAHSEGGWMTTMWSYKVLRAEGGIGDSHWGMVTNAQPFSWPNVNTASLDELEEAIRSLGTMDLQVYDELRSAFTGPAPELKLPELPAPRLSAPQTMVPGWTARDIGGPLAGGQEPLSGGLIALYGGGNDIWGSQDQFRFMTKTYRNNAVISAEVESLEDTDSYAKAGLMARAGVGADAALAMITVFPSGEVQFAWRTANGAAMESTPDGPRLSFPVRLRLTRQGSNFIGEAWQDGGWKEVGRTTLGLPAQLEWGLISLSHSSGTLTRAVYRSPAVTGRG